MKIWKCKREFFCQENLYQMWIIYVKSTRKQKLRQTAFKKYFKTSNNRVAMLLVLRHTWIPLILQHTPHLFNDKSELRVLNLSSNRIGDEGATEISKLIEKSKSLEELNLYLDNSHELSRDAMLEKIILLTVSYFCVGTELRFLYSAEEEKIKQKKNAKKKIDEDEEIK